MQSHSDPGAKLVEILGQTARGTPSMTGSRSAKVAQRSADTNVVLARYDRPSKAPTLSKKIIIE